MQAKTTGIGVSAAAQLESEKQKWQKLLDQKQAELEHAKDQEASMVKRWHAKDNVSSHIAHSTLVTIIAEQLADYRRAR